VHAVPQLSSPVLVRSGVPVEDVVVGAAPEDPVLELEVGAPVDAPVVLVPVAPVPVSSPDLSAPQATTRASARVQARCFMARR
jgi:hypothetical protein